MATVKKKKMSPRAKKKLFQRIILGAVALVLSLGLIGSSIIWTLNRSNISPDSTPQATQTQEPTVAELEQKAQASPNDVDILVSLATAYKNEDQIQKAAETYEKASSLQPERDDIKTALAGCYVSLGQYDKAIPALQEIIGRDNSNKDAHYYYGHALVAEKDYAGAVREFEEYVRLAGQGAPEVANVNKLIETLKPLIKE